MTGIVFVMHCLCVNGMSPRQSPLCILISLADRLPRSRVPHIWGVGKRAVREPDPMIVSQSNVLHDIDRQLDFG